MDPRAVHLRQLSKDLGKRSGQSHWVEMSERIETLVKGEKKLNPNVDFYSASMYSALRIPVSLYTPIFAVSRTSGWTAHVLEQVRQQPPHPPPGQVHRPPGSAVMGALGPALKGMAFRLPPRDQSQPESE